MIKYVDYDIVFQEVPGEVSLALNISNCPFRCEGCHSPHLREDIGENLERDLPMLLEKYKGMITCVLFLGEGNDLDALWNLIMELHQSGLKTALYTGDDFVPRSQEELIHFAEDEYAAPDYLKVGPYKKELGGLSSPGTNQRMYRWNAETKRYDDITYMFWRKPE